MFLSAKVTYSVKIEEDWKIEGKRHQKVLKMLIDCWTVNISLIFLQKKVFSKFRIVWEEGSMAVLLLFQNSESLKIAPSWQWNMWKL